MRDVCSPCAAVQGACEAAGDEARCTKGLCGRGCATDSECGAGFHCLATTSSGDLQCVSDVGCKNGTNACQSDAQCKDSTCRAGVCVGPIDAADGGSDAGDAGAPEGSADAGAVLDPGGGGCNCDVIGGESVGASRTSWGLASFAAAVLALALRHRARRRDV